jgi:hypothetical protein
VRGSSYDRSHCWLCSTTVRVAIGHMAYFSYSRGSWRRVPVCLKCVARMFKARQLEREARA